MIPMIFKACFIFLCTLLYPIFEHCCFLIIAYSAPFEQPLCIIFFNSCKKSSVLTYHIVPKYTNRTRFLQNHENFFKRCTPPYTYPPKTPC